MSGSGYIKLNRRFFDNAYWKQERTFSFSEAWLDLIQLARFEEEPTHIILPNGRSIIIKRGEIRASLRFLSSRWGWGVEKTKRFIDKHIEINEIERRTEQGESIITLCNYARYNPVPNTDQYTDQYTDRTPTSTPTSTKNKKEKKEKKEKEYNSPYYPPKGYESFDFSFLEMEYWETFIDWLAYKRERKEKYKSQKSLEVCFRQMLSLSGNSPEIAARIVDQSIGNNWAGLFELKQKGGINEHQSTSSKHESYARKQHAANTLVAAQREWELNNQRNTVQSVGICKDI